MMNDESWSVPVFQRFRTRDQYGRKLVWLPWLKQTPCAGKKETGSKPRTGQWFIDMDAQDFFRKRPASNAANPQIRIGAGPPGSAGVPPAFVSAQPPASPPPRSIGKHATDLLRPSLPRSRCQGFRRPHRRPTERLATAVHAGETPALPGGPHSVTASQQRTSIGIRVYSCSFVVRLQKRSAVSPSNDPHTGGGGGTWLKQTKKRAIHKGPRRNTGKRRTA